MYGRIINSEYHCLQVHSVVGGGVGRPINIVVRKYSVKGVRVCDSEICFRFAGRLDAYGLNIRVSERKRKTYLLQ